jgi:hypothetical protein
MKHRSILLLLAVLILAALCNADCGGYHLANRAEGIPSHVRTIGIPTFKNFTQRYEIEQRLTQALVREFAEKSKFSISSADKGVDAVLRGEVTNMGAVPVIFGRETFGSVFLVFINCRVSLLNLKDNKILYQNNNVVFRDQYVLNSDVAQFFSEENSAIDRIAKDFASSLVASIMESF